MALMTWKKYNVSSSSTIIGYKNDRADVRLIGRFIGGATVTGYTDYGFSPSTGYYGIGWTTSNSSVHDVTDTHVYLNTVGHDDDGYYMEKYNIRTCDVEREYSYYRGSYIEDVQAESGTYPNNGRYGGYWYVLQVPAFPQLKFNINGVIATTARLATRVDNQIARISDMWIREGNSLRKLQ